MSPPTRINMDYSLNTETVKENKSIAFAESLSAESSTIENNQSFADNRSSAASEKSTAQLVKTNSSHGVAQLSAMPYQFKGPDEEEENIQLEQEIF